jgi:eukaryotic-like serine/threonine-protein kinase
VSGTELQQAVAVGDVVDGKYRVERMLGSGGMGVVVAAENLALGSRVALKLLSPEARARPDRLERLRREARAAARLEGDHVARVLDLGGIADDRATPYIVLEYLEGEDLAARLARGGRLPIARAVDLVLEACEAIAEAHARGIVHRDLKPANLFLARRADGSEMLKVLDFGIAKHCEPEDAGAAPLTRTNDLLGSPRYMSPEQLRSSGDVTGRCDLWALGVVLFEIVTGTAAFDAESTADLAVAILSAPLPRPRDRRPDLPVELEAAILGCLERDAARRIGTVAELAAKIAPFGSERASSSLEVVRRWSATDRPGAETLDGKPSPPRALPLDETLSKSAVGTATTGPTPAFDQGPRRAVRGALAAGGLALAIALSVAAARWWPRDPPSERAPAGAATLAASVARAEPAPDAARTLEPPPSAEPTAIPASPAAVASAGVIAIEARRPSARNGAAHPRPAVASPSASAAEDTAAAPTRATPTSVTPNSEPCPDPNCSRK